MEIALLLIALGFGYKIYLDAATSGRKRTKNLGKIVALFIMIIAAGGALCKTVKAVKYGSSCAGYACPHQAGKMFGKGDCPFAGKPMAMPMAMEGN